MGEQTLVQCWNCENANLQINDTTLKRRRKRQSRQRLREFVVTMHAVSFNILITAHEFLLLIFFSLHNFIAALK